MINIKNLPTLSREDVAKQLESQGYAIGIMNPSEYHEAKKDYPISISKSTLFKAAKSLQHFHTQKPVTPTPAMEKGSIIDMLALTPWLFDQEYMTFDTKIDGRTKEGKEQAKAAKDADKTPFYLDANAEAVLAAKRVQGVLATELSEGYTTQVAMWMRTVISGQTMVISGMVDILPHNPRAYTLWDLKSTSLNLDDEAKLFAHMVDMGYGVQAAMYIDLFRVCGGDCLDEFTFLFVESAAPTRTKIVTMGDIDIARYRQVYLTLLADVACGYNSGYWGDHHLDFVAFQAPYWEEKDLTRKGFEV